MAPRAKEEIVLCDGADLSMNEFQSVRSDTSYFVNAGGVVHLTVTGTRRMSLVPVEVGEAYEAAKAAGTTAFQHAEMIRRSIVPPEVLGAWQIAKNAGITPERFLDLAANAVRRENPDQRAGRGTEPKADIAPERLGFAAFTCSIVSQAGDDTDFAIRQVEAEGDHITYSVVQLGRAEADDTEVARIHAVRGQDHNDVIALARKKVIEVSLYQPQEVPGDA